ncbi:MAG: MBL fold metallo-hydrolase [Armatimonadetes bacterium]|nr:MBL fold metallo-hydrolase [Anaerolineae bacterium]
MLLKYFYDDALSQASYLIGCPASGEALVIDPARDITPYLQFAHERNLRIIGAAETHIHADFASGGRELASEVRGTLFISAYGGEHGYKLQGDDSMTVIGLYDGSQISVGSVQLEAWHTPGHTPEHLCYLITAGGAAGPFALLSGDCVFAGDVGRPDLLQTAVGIAGAAADGARAQFASVQRIKTLPDYLQVLPGHGAGSACGKALGDVPTTSIGYEKLANPAFQFEDETAFSAWLLEGQPPAPRYFAQMKHINQHGAALLNSLPYPRPIVYDSEVMHAARALLIDTRSAEAFAAAHIPGAVNIPVSERKFSTWAGQLVHYDQPTYIVVDDTQVREVVNKLYAVGIDQLGGYVRPQTATRYRAITRSIAPQAADAQLGAGALILDVRDQSEYNEVHIPGALWIPLGEIEQRLAEIPREREVIVQCASGRRSNIATSLLQKHGYLHVMNLAGGIDAWRAADLPVEG